MELINYSAQLKVKKANYVIQSRWIRRTTNLQNWNKVLTYILFQEVNVERGSHTTDK
jgi:hypothetical protein